MYLWRAVDSHFIWKMEAVWISKTSAIQPIYKCGLTSKPFRKTADMPILLFNFPLTTDHWTCESAGPMGKLLCLEEGTRNVHHFCFFYPPSLPPKKEPTLPMKYCDNLKLFNI